MWPRAYSSGVRTSITCAFLLISWVASVVLTCLALPLSSNGCNSIRPDTTAMANNARLVGCKKKFTLFILLFETGLR